MHDTNITPAPTDDEAAAIMAALAAHITTDQPPLIKQATASGWHHSAKLQTQGLQPLRTARPPRWNTIERLRRPDHFGF